MMVDRWYETFSLGRYRYRLTAPVVYQVPAHPVGALRIESRNPCRTPLATLAADGTLTVLPGYSWDGATSAPDLRKLQRAVVLHDLLCQCVDVPGWHISRLAADRMFFREARKTAPLLAPVYFAGIRLGGALYAAFNPPELFESVRIVPV